MMGQSSDSNSLMAIANESKHEITSISPPMFRDRVSTIEESTTEESTIEESIEKSKSHWSELQEFDSNNEVVEVSNMKLFHTLQRHPTWGTFFRLFGGGRNSLGKLVIGKKFAKGGQAKLYEAQMKWNRSKVGDFDEGVKSEYVLKVFKKGTSLQQLRSQWPQGMLQFYAEKKNRDKLGLSQLIRFHSDVYYGTLVKGGRFAFLMIKEQEDLRSEIERRMQTRPKDKGPFSKDHAEFIMYEIAYGMYQLHDRGIVHRDIKASNVLRSCKQNYLVADFECSVGVVGTGFFRAPEILQACKDKNVSTKAELFTKAVDVYSYGMTCYEILTGKLPFEGHSWNDYDLVLQGQRPEVPNDVDDWVHQLLKSCWHENPLARPSFGEILKVLVANSASCRERKLRFERYEVALGIRKDSTVAKLKRSLRIIKQKMICGKGRNASC